MKRLIFVVILLAVMMTACIARGEDEDSAIMNPRTQSLNGRYVAVLRAFPNLGDFESATWDDIRSRPEETSDDTSGREHAAREYSIGFYKIEDDGTRKLIVDLPKKEQFDRAYVSNEGYLVFLSTHGETWESPFVSIIGPNGEDVATRRFGEIFDAETDCVEDMLDYAKIAFGTDAGGRALTISAKETEDGVVSRWSVDLNDGTLDTTSSIDCPPQSRVEIVTDFTAQGSYWTEGHDIPDFRQRTESYDVKPAVLFAHLREHSLPAYPEMAMKARVQGLVAVDIAVNSDGNVERADVYGLPFGITEAVEKCVATWKFAPYVIDGKRTRVRSLLGIRFEIVRPPRLRRFYGFSLQEPASDDF